MEQSIQKITDLINKKIHYTEEYNHVVTKLLEGENLYIGKMVSSDKSRYHTTHPKNEVYFNGNIFILDENHKLVKVFYGDIDITVNRKKLQHVANESKTVLYVLSEHDGRFNDLLDDASLVQFTKVVFNPQ